MRVLLVSNIFFPDRAGGAAVHSDFCYRLQKLGHDVRVHGAHPYYPEWTNKTGANLWSRADEIVNGIPVLRHGLYIPRTPGAMRGRLLQEVTFFFSLLRSVFRAGKPDVVVAICPLMSAVAYAWIVAKLNRAKLWLNIQDIMSDAAGASGIMKESLALRFARATEDFFMRRARVVSTIAPKMVRRLEERTDRKVLFFPNWLNDSMAESVRRHGPKKIEGRFAPVRLLYAGNIGRKQGLVEFCESLRKTTARFEMRIFGVGAAKHAVESWHQDHQDPRFSVGGFLSEDEFVQQLYWADQFVISETADVGASFIPSKLIPAIATGTPICAVCEPEGPLGEEVQKHGLGQAWRWDEIPDFVETLSRPIADHRAEFLRFHENCLLRARAYDGAFAVNVFCSIAAAVDGEVIEVEETVVSERE